MKTTSAILILSVVAVVIAAAVNSETAPNDKMAHDNHANDAVVADAVVANAPMKGQQDVQQLLNSKFGPKFGMSLKKADGSPRMCCECPEGACDCCPIFGGFCCDH